MSKETAEHSSSEKVAVAKTLGKTGLNVCVFCSANDLPERYTGPAERFAQLIAEHGHNLVWGGSDVGLMSIIASGAQAGGAKIIGVSVEFLRKTARANADEMLVTKDLGERKASMLERADVVAILVGGLGTLDEGTDILEHKKHGAHNKPIVVLNTDNFYEGLQIQLNRMWDDGMMNVNPGELVHFVETPEAAISFVDTFLES